MDDEVNKEDKDDEPLRPALHIIGTMNYWLLRLFAVIRECESSPPTPERDRMELNALLQVIADGIDLMKCIQVAVDMVSFPLNMDVDLRERVIQQCLKYTELISRWGILIVDNVDLPRCNAIPAVGTFDELLVSLENDVKQRETLANG